MVWREREREKDDTVASSGIKNAKENVWGGWDI